MRREGAGGGIFLRLFIHRKIVNRKIVHRKKGHGSNMKSRKLLIILTIAACAVSVTACGKNKTAGGAAEGEIVIDDDGPGIVENEEYDEDNVIETKEYDEYNEREIPDVNTKTVVEDQEEIVLLTEKDTKAIAEEYLEGTNLTLKCDRLLDKEGDYYRLYFVQENGSSLDQQFAVNAVSGEILIYDPEDHAILPYSEFEYYDPGKDIQIEWAGTYEPAGSTSGKLQMMVESLEPACYYVTFYNSGKEVENAYAQVLSATECELTTAAEGVYEMTCDGYMITLKAKDTEKKKYEGRYELTERDTELED